MSTMTSAEVLSALRVRYAPPEWYLMSEVASHTGFSRTREKDRYADAIAISAYQAGKPGGEIHGIEIKVTRADFRNELADIGKSEAIRRYCDRWWLAVPAPSAKIVHGDELPDDWGLLEVQGDVARVVKGAPRLTPTGALQALPRAFVAAMVRRAAEARGEKEALKGDLLRAPMRQVAHGDYWHGELILQCGHVIRPQDRGRGIPKSVRCLPCAQGLPPALGLVKRALAMMNAEELQALATLATERAAQITSEGPRFYRGKLGLGMTPAYRATVEATLVDAVGRDADEEAAAAAVQLEGLDAT